MVLFVRPILWDRGEELSMMSRAIGVNLFGASGRIRRNPYVRDNGGFFGNFFCPPEAPLRGLPDERGTRGRRSQHAVMATASEWTRIRECAAAAGMEVSLYVVHRATQPDPLPATVLRRAVRELLLLSKL